MHTDFIPIPSEIPKSPDLSAVPHYVIMSKTVESLIGQNEDLMARLKVNIRQNLLLETQLQDQESIVLNIKAENSQLLSRAEILNEKDELLKTKIAQYESELVETLGALQQSQISKRKFILLESYQRRVRQWVRGQILNLRYQLKLQKQKSQELEEDILEQQSKASSFKTKMNDAVFALQIKEREHQKDIVRLVEDFESQKLSTQKDLERALDENKNLKLKLNKFHEIQKDLIETQSLSQNFESNLKMLQKESSERVELLTQQNQKLVVENAHFKIQNEILEKQKVELVSENRLMSSRTHETASRAEAMSALWSETQIQRAQLKLKNEAMIQLNRNLSLKLKAQRQQVLKIETISASDKEEQIQKIQDIESLMAEIETAILSTSLTSSSNF
jgi:hypothetical protein